jgi:hypothetical protein
VQGRVPLHPLHRYPRHRQSTYNACIYTRPPARRGGHGVLIINLCPLLHFSYVFSSLDIRLRRTPHRCPHVSADVPPSVSVPLALPSVQNDISTVAAMLLSTASSFTNTRLCAGRASPNTAAGRTPLELIPPPCPIFPRLHTPLHLPPSRSLESFSLPSMLVKHYYKVNHTSLKH